MPPVNIVDASNEQLETSLIKVRKLNIKSGPEFVIGFIQNVIFSLCWSWLVVRKADRVKMAEERETKTFQKISEVRKKISLCEGKRRAFFNRTEKEKKINKEKTFILKDEVNVNIYIFRYILEVCISINPKLHQISSTRDTIIFCIL